MKLIQTIHAQTNLGPITGFDTGFSATPADPASRFAAILSNIITTITFFGAIAFLFWFIIGALTWITSAGEPDKLDKAKKQMSTAIVGLFVLILSIPITYILGKVTGVTILDIESVINLILPQ